MQYQYNNHGISFDFSFGSAGAMLLSRIELNCVEKIDNKNDDNEESICGRMYEHGQNVNRLI